MSYDQMVAAANRYAVDVVEGRILACRWVKLACQRHIDDLKRAEKDNYLYRFDADQAAEICYFASKQPHVKGQWALRGLKIALEPWQLFRFACVFGWVHKETGELRFREAYSELPRKSGKTTECDVIAAYASSSSIAREQPLSMNVVDEHCVRSIKICHADQASSIYRCENHLDWTVTSAGLSATTSNHEKRRDVELVLEGIIPNERLFGIIYSIDSDDDWKNADCLEKANPNYGVSVSIDYLKYQHQKAMSDPLKAESFQAKHLGVWGYRRKA